MGGLVNGEGGLAFYRNAEKRSGFRSTPSFVGKICETHFSFPIAGEI